MVNPFWQKHVVVIVNELPGFDFSTLTDEVVVVNKLMSRSRAWQLPSLVLATRQI